MSSEIQLGGKTIFTQDGNNMPEMHTNVVIPEATKTALGLNAIPAGTTAERPGTPAVGMIRYNTDLKCIEYYDTNSLSGSTWHSVGPFVTVKFNGNNGSVMNWWGNYSSLTRNTTGNYTLNFATAVGDYMWYIDTDTNNSRSGNHVMGMSGMGSYYFVYNSTYFTFTTGDVASTTRSDSEIVWVSLWSIS
jgi:hypothetical protein